MLTLANISAADRDDVGLALLAEVVEDAGRIFKFASTVLGDFIFLVFFFFVCLK
jgi:hypothetical protein